MAANIRLTRSSTGNPTGTPTNLDFQMWQNIPQKTRKQIDKLRRVGSDTIIRQYTGAESVITTCLAVAGFNDDAEMDTLIDNVRKACDETTKYTWVDGDSTMVVSDVCLLDFTYEVFVGKYSIRGTAYDYRVEFTINLVVDNRDS